MYCKVLCPVVLNGTTGLVHIVSVIFESPTIFFFADFIKLDFFIK